MLLLIPIALDWRMPEVTALADFHFRLGPAGGACAALEDEIRVRSMRWNQSE
jgi:hypothetical protein